MFISVEENNEMMERGFKYAARGDFEVLGSIDPWSGMPDVKETIHFFMNEADAAAYAATQKWPFSGLSLGYEKLEHMKTAAEREAKEQAIKDRKRAREQAKADSMGLSLDEYQERKKTLAKARRYQREIEEMEIAISQLKEKIAWRRQQIQTIHAEIGD